MSNKQKLIEGLNAERSVVTNYTERITQAEEFGDKGLVRLEDIPAEETDHAEELERLAG